MPADKAQLIGGLAVEKGLITREQLREALEEFQGRQKAGSQVPLGEVLVGLGLITRKQLTYLLELQGGHRQPRQQIPGFELIKKLGEGGTGGVFLARQVSMDRLVALKVLRKSLSRDNAYIDRFMREARLATKLDHGNIVRALYAAEAGGFHYLVMEYVEGRNLFEFMPGDGGGLAEPFVMRLALQVANALEHAHAHGIVHRDIKPDNILIDGKGLVKLTDLGLAKHTDAATRLTQSGLVMGTPDYISPEQALGEAEADARSDIYSLGATIYHLVTGRPPFEGPNVLAVINKHISERAPWPQDVNPETSEPCCLLLQKMMAKDPADRYQTPAELRPELELVANGKYPRHPLEASRASSIGKSGTVIVAPRRPRPPRREVSPEAEQVATVGTRPLEPVGGRPAVPRTVLILAGAVLLLVGVCAGALLKGSDDRSADFKDMYVYAELYRQESPDRFDEAIRKFDKVRR
ncbi:MAG: serine/threonine-protein kinase, partial [Planctomycetota bacterium]